MTKLVRGRPDRSYRDSELSERFVIESDFPDSDEVADILGIDDDRREQLKEHLREIQEADSDGR